MIILAGDIGGTNTRLLLAESNGAGINVLYRKDYASQEYADFYEVLLKFIEETNNLLLIDAVCIGVAGPVTGNQVSVTNLPWVIKEKIISDVLKAPNVKLINDFFAVSYGVGNLSEKDFILIQQGMQRSDEHVPLSSVVIGAGTGLGVSCRFWANDRYHIISSEMGHIGFAPENELQSRLLIWLQQKFTHVSLEELLSGRGFEVIYRFLHQETGIKESKEIREQFTRQNIAQVISNAALANSDELCVRTLQCFVEIYGAAAGNAALSYYPVGEVYIAGGIAPIIREKIQSSLFIEAFNGKAMMSSNMKKIAIKLIVQEDIGLYGALAYGRETSC